MIRMIAAVTSNWAIGVNGGLPFSVPEDLAHFKRQTLGCDMIMGRKTYESLPKILPGRRHIVLTTVKRDSDHSQVIFSDIEGLSNIKLTESAYVIGGSEIYSSLAHLCQELVITHVDVRCEDADTYFPTHILDNFEPYDATELVPGLAKVVKYLRVR